VIAVESDTVPDMTYAVHTATCTYLLDEDGVCLWTHAPLGVVPPGSARCVGAQFVACLDLAEEGGLVGELRPKAAALFVRREGDRLVLLRTLPIEVVEIRPKVTMGGDLPYPLPQEGDPYPVEDPHSFAETPIMAVPDPFPEQANAEPFPAFPFPQDAGTPEPPLPAFNPEETAPLDPRWSSPGEALGLEDLLSISVTEVTLTLPLYRPPQPAPHPPPRRSVIGPGRRLR
jgi:hypothetical protein